MESQQPDAPAQQHTSIRFFQKSLFRLLPEHIHDFLYVNWSPSRQSCVLKNILFNPTAMKLKGLLCGFALTNWLMNFSPPLCFTHCQNKNLVLQREAGSSYVDSFNANFKIY